MTVTNDTKLITSVQVKRQLKSVHTDKPEIKNSLLKVIEQFQCLDHIAKSTGLVKEDFSFANRISWDTVLSKLEHAEKNENVSEEIKLGDMIEIISQLSSQLKKELIPQLQKWRNIWMAAVILIELVFAGLLSLLVINVTHVQGVWSLSNIAISFQSFFYQRPVFSLIAGILLFISFFMMHFSLRNFVAGQFAGKLNEKSSEFDLAGAFLKNTRIQHSIFRPGIIGWNWLNRKCLLKDSDVELNYSYKEPGELSKKITLAHDKFQENVKKALLLIQEKIKINNKSSKRSE